MDFKIKILKGEDISAPPNDNENIFIDRRKNSEALLMILAGYKPYLFEDVFARVKAFAPKDFDICITSSGLFDETLNKIAAENNWSYLSTAENIIPLAQNLTIMVHEKATIIFKIGVYPISSDRIISIEQPMGSPNTCVNIILLLVIMILLFVADIKEI